MYKNEVTLNGVISSDPFIREMWGENATFFTLDNRRKWISRGDTTHSKKNTFNIIAINNNLQINKGDKVSITGELDVYEWGVEGIKKHKTQILCQKIEIINTVGQEIF